MTPPQRPATGNRDVLRFHARKHKVSPHARLYSDYLASHPITSLFACLFGNIPWSRADVVQKRLDSVPQTWSEILKSDAKFSKQVSLKGCFTGQPFQSRAAPKFPRQSHREQAAYINECVRARVCVCVHCTRARRCV